MSFYRVKQFLWAIDSMFKKIDNEFLDKYLTIQEKKQFLKLKSGDREHCIRVCKDCIKYTKENNINIDNNKLAKTALLHDIGKTEYSLNAIQKSIVVLADKAAHTKMKKLQNIKIIDSYYNHPKKGIKILKEINNYDEDILEVVLNHHKDDYSTDNKMFHMIRYYDNKN